MPVIDGDYLPAAPLDGGLQEWTKDVPLMIGSVFGETNSFAEVDPNAVNKNDWTDEEVSEKLTEKFGENAEAVLEAFRRAWPEKKDANAYYVDDSRRRAAFEVVEKRNESGAENNYIFLLSYESPVDGGVSMWHCGEIPFIFHNLDLTGVGASYGNRQKRTDCRMKCAVHGLILRETVIPTVRMCRSGALTRQKRKRPWSLIRRVVRGLLVIRNYRI